MGASGSDVAPDRAGAPPREPFDAIDAEFAVALGRPERVEAACADLAKRVDVATEDERRGVADRLCPLLARRAGSVAAPVFELVVGIAKRAREPGAILRGLLRTRDPALLERAIALASDLARERPGDLLPQVARGLAEVADRPGTARSVAAVAAAVRAVAAAPPGKDAGGADDPLVAWLANAREPAVRRLAARVLDGEGHLPHPVTVEHVLGPQAAAALAGMLSYTRAGHLDLLALVPRGETSPPVLRDLETARATCGERLLREVVADLGWPRVNAGIEVRRSVDLAVAGGFPVRVAPSEAGLFEGTGARPVGETLEFVAHGVAVGEARVAGDASSSVPRFREQNLLHAEALAEFLDVAPLSAERVARLLDVVGRLVAGHVELFAAHASECDVLADVHRELRDGILATLERDGGRPSDSLTRTVLGFEDPRTPGQIRSLHGLKRYLHQAGLQLGGRLLRGGAVADREIAVAVAAGGRLRATFRDLRWTDFEAEEGAYADGPPFAIRAIADAFARQLVCGHRTFPAVRAFVFGTEVHVFASYGTHPAFARIHFAPPARGGMVDLETFGVSKFDLGAHPRPALDTLRAFLERLGFDVEIDGTRVHARFDKERALDVAEVTARAAALFRLLPYLMDLDWWVGDLELPEGSRERVVAAWADAFAARGVLPVGDLLTSDRRGIRVGTVRDAAGVHEVAWRGDGPYTDAISAEPDTGWHETVASRVRALGLDAGAPPPDGAARFAQVEVERIALGPVREALTRGEVVVAGGALVRASPVRFAEDHETEAFARLIARGGDELAAAAGSARVASAIEPMVRFRTTGTALGREVQRARIELPGVVVGLFVLRDDDGAIRLALHSTRGDRPFLERVGPDAPWRSSLRADPGSLAAVLRSRDALPGSVGAAPGARPEDATSAQEAFLRPPPDPRVSRASGERVVEGARAAAGRAAGRAVLGHAGRGPGDVAGAVLVTPGLRPEDQVFLVEAAAVVSTGGGVLSHAGMLAMQAGKPAVVVAGGWERDVRGRPVVRMAFEEYGETASEIEGLPTTRRTDVRRREHLLREGEIVVVDADAACLHLLGGDPATVGAHDDLVAWSAAVRALDRVSGDRESLEARGALLRARHRLARRIVRIDAPATLRHVVHELAVGAAASGDSGPIAAALTHPHHAADARTYLASLATSAGRAAGAAAELARRGIPRATSIHEVLTLHLAALASADLARAVAAALAGAPSRDPGGDREAGSDAAARRRLAELREAASARAARGDGGTRHALRTVEIVDDLLDAPDRTRAFARRLRASLRARDRARVEAFAAAAIVEAGDAGHALWPSIGRKAANLAEVAAALGPGLVPGWFAVTDEALLAMLDRPVPDAARGAVAVPEGAGTLRAAVAAMEARSDLEAAMRARAIRTLWEAVPIPGPIESEIVAAYRRLVAGGAPEVAVRSSGREEDTEAAARAGEFDTYLFVRGERAVLDRVRSAWAGLWSERAVALRERAGAGSGGARGGVLVQRMVRSRVAGVVHTVDVPGRRPRDLVINVGLGLGEGVVSGTVEADHVTVSKEVHPDTGPMRLRYDVRDKRERIVADETGGGGTVRVAALYHQRLRPALEYVELSDLVRASLAAEAYFEMPLDLEFAFDESRLWILQARPVPAYAAAVRGMRARRRSVALRCAGSPEQEEP